MPSPRFQLDARPTVELTAKRSWVGRYEILDRLAIGGMGEILLARAVGAGDFEKLVVLKRILPQYAQNARFVEMFLAEARLAATLHHPNIVQVHDIIEEGGNYYIAMEYVFGENVATLLAANRGAALPIDQAIVIVMGAAAGLHHAHEARSVDGRMLGIVHRDVSPANVLVSHDGCVKVVDFGIAKANTERTPTDRGMLKGKIPYMSPEQCAGLPLDRRSDIFSLGILLYELSTGSHPWPDAPDVALLRCITEEDAPAPSLRMPGYPRGLEPIVARALARDRDDRYATAQELLLALDELARSMRLSVSTVALAQTMSARFGHKIEAWKEAQTSGLSEASLTQLLTTERAIDTGDTKATVVDRRAVAPQDAVAAAPVEPRKQTRVAERGRRGARRTWWWLAGAAVAGAAVLAAAALRQPTSDPPAPVPAQAVVMPPTPSAPDVTLRADSVVPPAIAPSPSPSPSPPAPRATTSAKPKRRVEHVRKPVGAKPPPVGAHAPGWDPDSPIEPR